MRILSSVVLTVVLAGFVAPAGASDAPAEEEVLLAPFACGTEWQGTTYGGHGQDNLTLDLNRTSQRYPDALHDLGQPILAQGDGTVVHVVQAGWNSGAGTYLEVDYGDVTAVYVHLVENSIAVEVGDTVTTGQLLAQVGNTGNIVSSTPEKLAHLHLAYWDSSGMTDARAYQLSTQIPVRIDGVDIIATASPRAPSPAFVSTNCGGDAYPFVDVPMTSFARAHIELLFELGITEGSGAGRYEPDKSVNREQMAAFLARLWRSLDAGATELPEEIPLPFADAADSFARDDIALLAHLGITDGSGDGSYSPGAPVTREQMAAFLARLWRFLDAGATELSEPLDDPFVDVPDESIAHDDILLLAHLLITSGVDESRFAPEMVVDREQMAAFLARLHSWFGEPA